MKPFQRLLAAAPVAALLPFALAPASSLASEAELNLESVQGYSIAQATTIRDFSDVYPTDWAYQALAELVDTYGCAAGFGDGTFRGQQPITRFETAAILNACLTALSAKMEMAMMDDADSKADMETLEQLVASFEAELITLKGAVDGLDAKVSEMEDSHFSTTTKASFEIATDFLYFSSEDTAAKALLLDDDGNEIDMDSDGEGDRREEDNSGLALSSEVEIEFETSFTGSDKLTFSLSGDLLPYPGVDYLGGEFSDFYGAKGDEGEVSFGGFTYETGLDMGGTMTTLVFGTDVDDLDPIVGLDTYYGGSGFGDFGPSDFGDAGVGFSVDLLSSDVGTMTVSAGYAVDGDHAADQKGDLGIFGEETDRSGALALSWEGALFGGNDALFTVAYQNIKENDAEHILNDMVMADVTKGYFHLVAGAYFTDTISLSGSYSFGTYDYDMSGVPDPEVANWMVAVNMDDAIFPGNSAGIAYGTPEFNTDPETDPVMKVIEVYYTFAVNDSFEIPVYLDFISNAAHMDDAGAFAVAVRPTLSF